MAPEAACQPGLQNLNTGPPAAALSSVNGQRTPVNRNRQKLHGLEVKCASNSKDTPFIPE